MKEEKENRKLYVADFETTVDDGEEEQKETEVWSAACAPVLKRPEPEDVTVYNNIFQFIDWLSHREDKAIVFFHNLRFDGSFILDELNREGFLPCMSMQKPDHYATDWEMSLSPFTYKVLISDMGQWYSIKIMFDDRMVEIRDSAKKIPSTLEQMGKDFNTKYRKKEMVYEGKRKQFGKILPKEMEYIINDILVLSEAMYIVWYEYGMHGLTIASDALKTYKELITEPVFDKLFPDLQSIMLPCGIDCYEYCKKSYSGGWCYKNPMARLGKTFVSTEFAEQELPYTYTDTQKKNGKIEKTEKTVRIAMQDFVNPDSIVYVKNSLVCDVNSLYPSMMLGMSDNEYPVGEPHYHKGEPDLLKTRNYAVFRRFKCNFRLKEGYLPFLHIRCDRHYNANECLETSYLAKLSPEETCREYVMTQVEFRLFKEHYEIYDYEPIDFVYFEKAKGIFDVYINKFAKMKIEATKEKNKAKRTIAKLYLNSLYGKLATSTNSSYKTVYFEDDTLRFDPHIEYNKKPISVSAGAYITAYARNFTIRACQANYYPGEYRGFMYADTDSAHMIDYDIDDIKGMKFSKTDFCCWDIEVSKCAIASYAKQKTYLEFSVEESGEKVLDKDGNQTYNIICKAAGLSDNGKDIFIKALMNDENPRNTYINMFKPGLCIRKCNLKSKQIKGGVLLVKSDYKMI